VDSGGSSGNLQLIVRDGGGERETERHYVRGREREREREGVESAVERVERRISEAVMTGSWSSVFPSDQSFNVLAFLYA